MTDRRIMTTRGAECVLNGAVIDKFASNLRGSLIAPDDQDYEAVRIAFLSKISRVHARMGHSR